MTAMTSTTENAPHPSLPIRAWKAKLLEPCRAWLRSFLGQKCSRANITIIPDTDRRQLRSALNDVSLGAAFPESSAWEVKVDVVGVVSRGRRNSLAFVELKVKPISLVNVGQLLGYCRVCRPTEAFLLSSMGLSSDLYRLLTTYGRTDILRFESGVIRVGGWDVSQGSPDWSTVIPPGSLSQVKP